MNSLQYKISSKMLLGFGSHFGTLFFQDWNSDSSAYVHSQINSRFLIDLSFTSFMFTRALNFFTFFISRKLKFLVFLGGGFMNFLNKVPNARRFWLKNFFLINKWIPGTLTNYKSVRGKLIKFRDRTNFLEYANGLIYLGSIRFLNNVSMESRLSKLPSIGFIDMDSGFSPFSYSVPSNNKSFSVLFAYYCLLLKSAKRAWVIQSYSYNRFSNLKVHKLISLISHFGQSKILSNLVRKHVRFAKFTLKGFFSWWNRRKLFIYNIFNKPNIVLRFRRVYLDLFLKLSVKINSRSGLFFTAKENLKRSINSKFMYWIKRKKRGYFRKFRSNSITRRRVFNKYHQKSRFKKSSAKLNF